MKGIFIPDITVEMFRNGCLEAIETIMAEGEVYDIEYDSKSAEPERKKGKWLRSGNCIFPYECDQCGDTNGRPTPFCPNCGAKMEG